MTRLRTLVRVSAALLVGVAPLVLAGSDPVPVTHQVQPDTGIESWEINSHGVEIMMMQISPDQARGFFLARGFKRKDVDYYAASCIFATVVKNHSTHPMKYRLADWRYAQNAVSRKLKLKDDWLREWKQRGISPSAQIAFEWSQHPAEQILEPGDWNQGMTTYLVPHGSRIDLTVKWKIGEEGYEEIFKGIRCAK